MDDFSIDVDYNIELISSIFSPSDNFFNAPNTTDLNNNAVNPTDVNTSNDSNEISPSGLFSNLNDISLEDLNNNTLELLLSNTNPISDAYNTSLPEVIPREYPNENIKVLVEPKRSYRARYMSEIDNDKNRANRFIRAEQNDKNYDYPTITIPSWYHPNQQLYIQVTLVTVPNKRVSHRFIHPYEIDTPDENAIKIENDDSLFFRIKEIDYHRKEKSFQIIVKKKKHDELKLYGPMRLFNPSSEQIENVIIDDTLNIRQRISLYELSQSQFVFTIVKLQNDTYSTFPLHYPSIISQPMVDEPFDTRSSPTNHPNGAPVIAIKCIPQQGNWQGGDEIVIILTNRINKRKAYTICFDFGEYGQPLVSGRLVPVDTKTLLFQTPSCPIPEGDNNLPVTITIRDNKSIISQFIFLYLTSMKNTINLCSHCQTHATNNKRKCQTDNVEILISQMNQLSFEQKTSESHSRIASNETYSKFEKYFYQLKDALEIFIRTNNPSQLFRQTSKLLLKNNKNSLLLHDAIQHGYTEIAITFLEQIIHMSLGSQLLKSENENGETILLIAVKLNEWKLIEMILKNRCDLAKQKDKDGNNLFHLLANLSEDKGGETIENILRILPDELKINLLKEKNKMNEKPIDIAEAHGSTSNLKLLVDIKNN